MQKWTICKLNPCFIFVYLHQFENCGFWTLYQKGKKKQINSLLYFIPKIEFFCVHSKICLHLVFKVSVSVSLKYKTIFHISWQV